MAIKSNVNEVNQLNENVQKKNNLQGILGDTLLWLSQSLNNKIIVDGWMVNQLQNIINGITPATQIATTTTQITGQRRTYRGTPNNAGTVAYNTGTLQDTITSIKNVEAEKENTKRNSDNARSSQQNLQKPQGNNPAGRTTYNTQFTTYQDQINTASDDISEYDRVLPLLKELQSLQELAAFYGNSITTRTQEINAMITLLWNYNFGGTINNMINVGANRPYTIGEPAVATGQALWVGCFLNAGATPNISYNLCDKTSWEELPIQNNVVQIATGTQTIWLSGLRINGNQLELDNLQIQSFEGVKFPLNIQIVVRGRIQDPSGVNLDHYKTFNLTINAPQLAWSNAQNPTWANTPRATAYTNLNQWGAINNRLVAEYSDPTRTTIENEIIREILRANGNQAEIDKIYNNQQQRDLLIERIRNIPQLIPIFTIANLQNGFMNEMIRENRNVPIQHLISINAFTDYLRNNLETNIRDFVRGQIRTAINITAQRNNILRTVMDFQSDVINDKLDNNDHRTLNQNIPNIRPQGHPNTRQQRLTRRRSNRNNWTKFLDGRESKLFEDKLETNEGELSFDLKVAVHGVNKIVTTINIKGEDEPIILDTRDVNEMTHMILRLEATKSGEPINRKLRCRMALNAVKAVVAMSPTTLHRQYQGNVTAVDGQIYQIDRLSTHIRWGNLVLRGSCANSHNNPPTQYRQRVNHVVFDEQRYKWLHNINELERGMVGLSGQINDIMNSMGNEFRQATSHIKAAPLMKYNTTKYLRWGPIKRLRWRMVYGKTNWKFDFDTSATSWSKTANIKFEKGKFTLSGTFKDKPFEFKGRSLGTILRKKIDRLRVFDGVELPIFEKINEAMITQLRTNNLISPENFWVSDLNTNKTGRVFFMDSQGDLSYIEIEDRNLNPLRNGRTYGRINFNDLPPQRIRCNETERREFMQNPLLSGRLIRAMRNRLRMI